MNEHAKEQPVALHEPNLVDAAQPHDESLARRGVERRPEFLRRERERESECRLLDAALIIIAREPPVFPVRGIDAGRESLLPERPVREIAAASRERNEPPERPRVTFEPASRFPEVPEIRAKPNLRAPGGKMRRERLDKVARELLDVRAGAERIGREFLDHGFAARRRCLSAASIS